MLATPRWVGWTLLAVAAVIVCGGMAYWQLIRAESPTGSLLNAGYALQWPLFGVFFAYLSGSAVSIPKVVAFDVASKNSHSLNVSGMRDDDFAGPQAARAHAETWGLFWPVTIFPKMVPTGDAVDPVLAVPAFTST